MRNTDLGELEQRADEETLTELEGIGDSIARLITEALAGGYPSYLEKIEAETPVPITEAGAEYAALRGDCHCTRAGATAATRSSRWRWPHRPRPRVHGVDRSLGPADDRPRARRAAAARQLDEVARINADIAAAGHDFRILTGMEVDINEDGTLDLADSMLARLDVVVASVHSKPAWSARR